MTVHRRFGRQRSDHETLRVLAVSIPLRRFGLMQGGAQRRALALFGLILFVASFSWNETGLANPRIVEVYSLQGASRYQLWLRVLPVLGVLVGLVLMELRGNRRGWQWLVRWPGAAISWYAVAGIGSGLGGRLPYLACWKGLEILVVIYWVSHVVRLKVAKECLLWMIKLVSIYLIYVVATGPLYGADVLKPTSGPVPIWLTGKFPPANPNTLGAYAAVSIWALWNRRVGIKQRLGRVVAWATCGFVLVTAQSRTAYIALTAAISMDFTGMFLWSKVRRDRLRIAVAFLLVPLGIIVADQLVRGFTRGQEMEEVVTLSGRTEYWRTTRTAISEHPWAGGGHATGSRFLYLDHPGVFKPTGVNLHNSYLEAVVGAGFIGAVPFLSTIVLLPFYAVRKVFIGHGRRLGWVLGVGLILFVRSLTSISLSLYSMELILFALVLAVISNAYDDGLSRPELRA